jgi:ADP-heptose:LPS heptosyltransferase
MLADDDWNSPAFLHRYSDYLSSNYLGEIFCRLAYVETDYFRLELPIADVEFEVPDILVHATTTRPAKMWPMEYWRKVIDWCDHQRLSVGLVGSAPKLQQALYHGQDLESDLLRDTSMVDLRGRTSPIELAGAMKRARACVSVDAGPLHVAAAVGCPTVAVFGNDEDGDGASPLNLWAPRMDHVRIMRSTYKCTLCADNRFKNERCLVDGHPCMQHLQPDAVIEALQELLHREMRPALGE